MEVSYWFMHDRPQPQSEEPRYLYKRPIRPMRDVMGWHVEQRIDSLADETVVGGDRNDETPPRFKA